LGGVIPGQPAYTLEFYEEPDGREPVRQWIKDDLTPEDRRTVGAAMREILQEHGVGVCGTRFGRQLRGGLFEFRLREEGLLVRVFCHAYGNRVVLLLGAYDKGRDPSPRRQDQEIEVARTRLQQWKARQRT
jgi:phage-related protein